MVQTEAAAEVRARIARKGKITFAEYMEVALYHRPGGYYEGRGRIGAGGDYYTSAVAHPAFGGLLAVQLQRMWQLLGRPGGFWAVELGAGSGALARDIVEYSRSLEPRFSQALSYVAVDRSRAQLASEGHGHGFHQLAGSGVPFGGVVGCVLSNELADSFPVHRLQVVGGETKEVFVTVEGGELVEILGEPSSLPVARRAEALDLEDGYRGEVNLGIDRWMEEVGAALTRGFVLTIDYGYLAAEPSTRSRDGTVRTYYNHVDGVGPYRRTGEQDITAYVDFSRVIESGGRAGLNPVGMCTQGRLLDRLGIREWLLQIRGSDVHQRERDANMMGLRELSKPGGLGGFKVLVQEKGTGVAELSALAPPRGSVSDLPVPLLRQDHIALMEGRYPHLGWDWEGQVDLSAGEGRAKPS